MRVERQHTNWAEKGQREIGWFTFEEAAELVEEQGLVALLVGLALNGIEAGDGRSFKERVRQEGGHGGGEPSKMAIHRR
jgi:hypothetical protein